MSEELVKQATLFRRVMTNDSFVVRAQSDAPRTLSFAASSELPVERWYGMEVLSHEKSAVRMDRAVNGAMPLLFNHDVNDPIGMITGASLKDARLIVQAALFDTPRAAEVQTMIDGGLRNVSLAYRVNALEEHKKSGTFTATDWEPYEVSIVTVPADPSVGIGRGAEQEYQIRMIRHTNTADSATSRRIDMGDEKKDAAVEQGTLTVTQTREANVMSPLEMEQRRKKGIENLCKANKLDDNMRDMFVGMGMSMEEVSEEILKVIEERGKTNPQSVAKIGMTSREVQQFSLSRAILACSTGVWKDAPFELDCIKEATKRSGKALDPHRFVVPFEVLQRPMTQEGLVAARSHSGRRDLTVASAGGGGFLVGTENMGFIEMLRNRSVCFSMGARRLSGLSSSVTIPRQSVAGTAYWLGNEAAGASESQQTFVQVALSPKTAGAYTEISRQLLLQSNPGAEGIVTDDLAQIVAIAADLAALNGSGSAGQPQGLIGTANVGSVAAGSANYSTVLEFQTDVATNNVRPLSGGYVTTPVIAGYHLSRQRFTSTDTPLWVGNVWDGEISGFRAMSSNQVPAGYMVFGDWNEMIIGEWGVLEVEVNPYANFQAGIIGVRALYSLDVGIKRPFAFSVCSAMS